MFHTVTPITTSKDICSTTCSTACWICSLFVLMSMYQACTCLPTLYIRVNVIPWCVCQLRASLTCVTLLCRVQVCAALMTKLLKLCRITSSPLTSPYHCTWPTVHDTDQIAMLHIVVAIFIFLLYVCITSPPPIHDHCCTTCSYEHTLDTWYIHVCRVTGKRHIQVGLWT